MEDTSTIKALLTVSLILNSILALAAIYLSLTLSSYREAAALDKRIQANVEVRKDNKRKGCLLPIVFFAGLFIAVMMANRSCKYSSKKNTIETSHQQSFTEDEK